ASASARREEDFVGAGGGGWGGAADAPGPPCAAGAASAMGLQLNQVGNARISAGAPSRVTSFLAKCSRQRQTTRGRVTRSRHPTRIYRARERAAASFHTAKPTLLVVPIRAHRFLFFPVAKFKIGLVPKHPALCNSSKPSGLSQPLS